MSAIRTQGIKVSYKNGSETVELKDCLGIPELGGSRDKIEITTLDSEAHVYMNGLYNYGDSLDFQFLYKDEQFKKLYALGETVVEWTIALPAPAEQSATFSGECSVRLDAAGLNDKITYTLSIAPTSAISFAE